jgi:oligopeptide/dipeptide ABC transporter ATP-binding protein
MYAGVVVEYADISTLFSKPKHPYTHGLMNSIPKGGGRSGKMKRLNTIEGIVPSLLNLPPGCKFSNRCPKAFQICLEKEPPLITLPREAESGHQVRCWLHSESGCRIS